MEDIFYFGNKVRSKLTGRIVLITKLHIPEDKVFTGTVIERGNDTIPIGWHGQWLKEAFESI